MALSHEGLPIIELEPVDRVKLTILVDNLTDKPGFSALVRLRKGERERMLLFDTGVSPGGMVENMRRLGISPGDIEVIVLSHGHWDHLTRRP